MSLGLFFLRVLTKRWQIHVFHVLLWVSALYGLCYVFITLFQCGNPEKVADRLLGSPKCLPGPFLLTAGYLYGTINIIADWTFVLIPISVLIDSELDRRSKVSVSLVMALGAVGSVSSVMRMVYLHGFGLHGDGITCSYSQAFLYFHVLIPCTATSIKATIWATAEPGTGIIAASIAILRPLVRKIATDVRNKASAYGSHKGSRPTPSFGHESDAIALTVNKSSDYSMRSDDPWNSTVIIGQANIQRVTSVQMFNGKGSPAPPRV